ncbi:MAG: heme exporter protein CcmB [Betaproteobacteria bacterium]|nr:heme exporter protein CcmB [Betaproteobacteria bacterium]
MRRDMLLLSRRPADFFLPPVFFITAAAVFPLALTPSPELLRAAAPGVIWSAAALSSLLTQDFLFRGDREDGALEQMLLSGRPPVLLAVAKAAAHWLAFGAPLALASPLLGLWLAMDGADILRMLWILPLGAGVFSMFSVFAAALLAGGRPNHFLGALITLPLCIPAVIFAAAAVRGDFAPLLLLGALFAGTATVLPWAAAGALKIGAGLR